MSYRTFDECARCLLGCVVVAVVFFGFIVPKLRGAPTPAPPRLSAELLVGRWRYDYGLMTGGWIEFARDGSYVSSHDPDRGPQHVGTWRVDGGALVLTERRLCPTHGVSEFSTRYEFLVSTRDYPAVVGTCNGAPVSLTDPRR